MKPMVSICVPNLNTLPYLPERFETIFAQTFQDWELLVYDSYSDDGAWEYIQELAENEPRMRAWQGPREGTPGSWAPCISEATGEYVYIATSDDTMPPDCLEKLVSAMEAHPGCDLAHCNLRAIDESGRDVVPQNTWWANESLFARSSGELIDRPHIRKAPHDALLHLSGETPYISITQLLIRRSLFEKTGPFEKRWGAPGDFAWDMRATMVADTIHVPDTWGGWRLHASQATDPATHRSNEHARKIDAMIEDAVAHGAQFLPPGLRQKLEEEWVAFSKEQRTFRRESAGHEAWLQRQAYFAQRLLAGSASARGHLKTKLFGRRSWDESVPKLVRTWLDGAGLGPSLVPVNGGSGSASPE